MNETTYVHYLSSKPIIETKNSKYFGYSYLGFNPFRYSICEGGASPFIIHWDSQIKYFYLRLRIPLTHLCFKVALFLHKEDKKKNFIKFYNAKKKYKVKRLTERF